ncbi:hypothetical protein SEA_ZOOMAN_296 [Microbacterium phage Zooman]|nr:hypothetical protein SEA_ZOOMAN_296 [Microbacterium phage Zooman]
MGMFGPPRDESDRVAHHLYAKRHGFFWMPCPLCSRFFGGHEWMTSDGYSSIRIEGEPEGQQTGICPTCTRQGRAKGEEIAPGFYDTRTYPRMDLDLRTPDEYAVDAYREYTGPKTGPWNGKVELTPTQIDQILSWFESAVNEGSLSALGEEADRLFVYLDMAKRKR